MLGGQAGGMFKLLDQVTNSGVLKKMQQAQTYYSYVSNFTTDVALYIFATLLMDAILITYH